MQLVGSDVLLYRLLFNLTENAIKYNRTGGSVELSVEQEHGQAAIRVRDTGPGIAEEYRDSIFQPFSAWISRAAAQWAAWDWDWRSCRRLSGCMAAQCALNRAQIREQQFW